MHTGFLHFVVRKTRCSATEVSRDSFEQKDVAHPCSTRFARHLVRNQINFITTKTKDGTQLLCAETISLHPTLGNRANACALVTSRNFISLTFAGMRGVWRKSRSFVQRLFLLSF